MAEDGKRLYLIDGMALAYRSFFALIRSPIMTSKGVNTSALFGFTNTLLDLFEKEKPSHLAVVFDTDKPTFRHEVFPEYKAQREQMPEDLAAALPHLKRLVRAFNLPVIECDGYEADDIIGTLARQAEEEGDVETFMVTPDKDFAQLVSERTKIWKPGRKGGEMEILGPQEVCERWQVEKPAQVIDILGLWGDSSDNIPGVPGVGEKTAKKLIGEFGSVESLLEGVDSLKGKLQERVREHAGQAVLSKRLATIERDVPVSLDWEHLRVGERDDEALRALFGEFEFNTLGRRVFGEEFKAGRGAGQVVEEDLFASLPTLRTLAGGDHKYEAVTDVEALKATVGKLMRVERFAFDTETSSLEQRSADLLGISFCWQNGEAVFVVFAGDDSERQAMLEMLRPVFAREDVEKIGQNLKYDLGVLTHHGVEVKGPFFDTMLAHALVEPSQRHSMDYMAESLLAYTPMPIEELIGARKTEQVSMFDAYRDQPDKVVAYACEDADITWQLAGILEPKVGEVGMERIFRDVECPLVPVLVAMEAEGIRLDVGRLQNIGEGLEKTARELEKKIITAADTQFNLNSPKQLGDVLFNRLKLIDKPKKTKTGQYVTNEQVLATLAAKHPIVADILSYREVTKLKNTYVDALPLDVDERTGRVHTHYHQLSTATGRLASSDPNLQNIPIRTELGRSIRGAFVPADEDHVLFSADYSQIELRVMAAMSGDEAMCEAFQAGMDIHAATAARVFGVELDGVTDEMRRSAKMVNFGIVYGISAFGLAQRLGVSRGEADEMIKRYFERYPGVRSFMDGLIAGAVEKGYVSTLLGRRRYLRDIHSGNANVRSMAERMAINTPIQGTAADMIKLAMIRIHREMQAAGLRSKMLLQVHDELVFDLHKDEKDSVPPLVVRAMEEALPLPGVPIVVDTGMGETWLQAH